jgi:hypothetical protein
MANYKLQIRTSLPPEGEGQDEGDHRLTLTPSLSRRQRGKEQAFPGEEELHI